MSSELLCGVYYENHTQTVFLYQDKTGWTVPSDHLFFCAFLGQDRWTLQQTGVLRDVPINKVH